MFAIYPSPLLPPTVQDAGILHQSSGCCAFLSAIGGLVCYIWWWSDSLQLGLGLSLLEDRLHLGGLHNITLDLELAAHEEALSVGLARDELAKVGFGKRQDNCN